LAQGFSAWSDGTVVSGLWWCRASRRSTCSSHGSQEAEKRD
jgi:hypothetical protein